MQFTVTKIIAPNLLMIETSFLSKTITSMWSVAKCRKHKKCSLCDHDLYGKEAYRPVSNKDDRMYRLKATLVNSMIKGRKLPIEL